MKISRDYIRKKSDASASADKPKEVSLSEIDSQEVKVNKKDNSKSQTKGNLKQDLLKNKRKRDTDQFTVDEDCLLGKISRYLKYICSKHKDENIIQAEKETIESVMTYLDKLKLPNPIETLKVGNKISKFILSEHQTWHIRQILRH